MPNAIDEVYRQYPRLRGLGLNFVDSTQTKRGGLGIESGRKMEYYPADERDNPKYGVPTIEIFDPSMRMQDVFGEIFSHHLTKTDPVFAAERKAFAAGLDQKQLEMLHGDYEAQAQRGLLKRNGRNMSFQEWINGPGGDAFFRGYVTNQYPAEYYRDDQKQQFNRLLQYLKGNK